MMEQTPCALTSATTRRMSLSSASAISLALAAAAERAVAAAICRRADEMGTSSPSSAAAETSAAAPSAADAPSSLKTCGSRHLVGPAFPQHRTKKGSILHAAVIQCRIGFWMCPKTAAYRGKIGFWKCPRTAAYRGKSVRDTCRGVRGLPGPGPGGTCPDSAHEIFNTNSLTSPVSTSTPQSSA